MASKKSWGKPLEMTTIILTDNGYVLQRLHVKGKLIKDFKFIDEKVLDAAVQKAERDIKEAEATIKRAKLDREAAIKAVEAEIKANDQRKENFLTYSPYKDKVKRLFPATSIGKSSTLLEDFKRKYNSKEKKEEKTVTETRESSPATGRSNPGNNQGNQKNKGNNNQNNQN